MRWLTRLTVLAAFSGVASCASVAGSRNGRATFPQDLITRKELDGVAGVSQHTYSAIERLRPQFLIVRPGSETIRDTISRVHVFINGNPVGDLQILKTIPLGNVESVRRLTVTEAYTQLGAIGAAGGVIMVQLR